MIWVKSGVSRRAQHAAMSQRVIPILPARPVAPVPGLPGLPLVSGQVERAQPLLRELESAVGQALGATASHWPLQRWLRELRLSADEAVVTIAPGLGHDGIESAEVAFHTLRRLLPDTDIYVGAAAA